MPLWHLRWSTVVAATVVFGAFLVRFGTLDENAVGRTVILIALVASGLVLFVLLEGLVLSRFAAHRARNPARLMAAVARRAQWALEPGDPLQDAVRLMLLRERFLEAPVLRAALPRTMGTTRGSRAEWLTPLMKNNANGVVLARTNTHLLVCQPDIDRVVHLVAAIPFRPGSVRRVGPNVLVGSTPVLDRHRVR